MNRQFDVIVIGDSKAGNEAVKNIAAANRAIKIAFISREFKSYTTRDFLNVEYIKDEVTFTDYKNRLFGCYMKSGDRFYCTHLIIASGLSYVPFRLGNKPVPGVFNTADDISKLAKNQQAIVLGNSEADAKLALAVAKKYKHVYVCTKSIELDVASNTRKKLTSTDNIVVLPNASIVKVAAADGELNTVELDNYSTLTCSAIFVKTASTPETIFVSDKLISKDTDGFLETAFNLESLLVPRCFATGNCVRKNTKKMSLAMFETILNDFTGGK
jgi:thioredoxin reductase